MDLPFSKEQLREATHELIGRNGLRSCYIRPLVFRGHGPMGLDPEDNPVEVTIAVWEWGAYLGEEGKRNGVRAKVSSWRRISPQSLIPHSKAGGQYLNSVLAKIESKRGGYEEAILLDDHGHVCEGSGENVFVVKDGKHRHPAADRQHPRRHQPQVGHPDRRRPGPRGGGARRGPRRADAGRRGVPGRHRRRAGAGARDRRHRDRPARRDHAPDPARLRRRPARARRALRRVARRGAGTIRRRERQGNASELPRRPQAVQLPLAPTRLRKAFTPMAEKVLLYDTTLRDGMQGEGMSLSADEKVRVAHALDDLGMHFIEAGFPSSNPKEEALFDLLSRETLRARRDRGLRHDAPARRRGRRRRGAARAGRLLRARLHAGGQDLVAAPGEGHARRPRGEPADDRRLGRVPARPGQAGDLRRRALLRRLRRRPRLRAALPARRRRGRRRERDAVRHQRRHAAHAPWPRPPAAWWRSWAATSQVGHPHPRRRRLRRGQLAGGRRARRAPGAGHDERLRRALRQRQPGHDPGRPPAQARATTACRPSGSGG